MQPARKQRPDISAPEAMPKQPTRESDRLNSARIISGSLWMVGISLALFFLPAVNGLLGGLVGGYKVGSAKNALIAAILPEVVVGLGLAWFLTVLGFPVVGLLAGASLATLIVLSEIGLLIGAAIGGSIRGMRPHR